MGSKRCRSTELDLSNQKGLIGGCKPTTWKTVTLANTLGRCGYIGCKHQQIFGNDGSCPLRLFSRRCMTSGYEKKDYIIMTTNASICRNIQEVINSSKRMVSNEARRRSQCSKCRLLLDSGLNGSLTPPRCFPPFARFAKCCLLLRMQRPNPRFRSKQNRIFLRYGRHE